MSLVCCGSSTSQIETVISSTVEEASSTSSSSSSDTVDKTLYTNCLAALENGNISVLPAKGYFAVREDATFTICLDEGYVF